MLSTKNIEKFDRLNVIQMYNDGMTFAEISKEIGTGYNQLHQYFIIKGIEARKPVKRASLRNNAPVGQKFGLWTVVSNEVKVGSEVIAGSKNRSLFWLVQCQCGNLAWKNPQHLKEGTSTRCKHCGHKVFLTKNGDVIVEALLVTKFNHIKQGLKTRKKTSKLEFTITPEYLSRLYNENHHCSLSGIDLSLDLSKSVQQQNLSVDRIDSNVGYVEGNIQLVDKRINMMKGTLSNDEFIDLCCKVAEKHGYSKRG